jgi:hypothetical protein
VSSTARNKQFSEQRRGQAVGKRKYRAMQQAAWQARCHQVKETSDSASGEVGIMWTGERNKRYSQRRRGLDVSRIKEQAIQRVAWRASCRQEKETSDAASSAMRGARGIGEIKKRAIQLAASRATGSLVQSDIASGAASMASAGERNERYGERPRGRGIAGRTKRSMQRATQHARRHHEKEAND